MLTLPLCAWIKDSFDGVELLFLGRTYTKDVINCYGDYIDEFINWDDFQNAPKTEKIQKFRGLEADIIIHVFPSKEIAALAKKARIKTRVGTSHRAYHMVTCSHRVNFTRKRSGLHEAQLNFNLLKPFGLESLPEKAEIVEYTKAFKAPKVNIPDEFSGLRDYYLLHPKSQGSALEWPMSKFIDLAKAISESGSKVVFTGTENEGRLFRDQVPWSESIFDSTGKLTLVQLIGLIQESKGLVACSTGPLHVAGFLGKKAVGLYSPRRPIHPGRWSPLGEWATSIVFDESCPDCLQGKDCHCIEDINMEVVLEKLK
jgi:ADP-heptose:LPS heptosyltransferase